MTRNEIARGQILGYHGSWFNGFPCFKHSPMKSVWIIMVVLFLACTQTRARADEAFFESRIRPVLIKHCYECHAGAKTKGGLALDTKAGWEKGGDNGPAIIPGKPEESLLIKAVRYGNKDLTMPPKSKGGKLSEGDITNLVQWVKMGAPDPRKLVKKIGGMSESEAKAWWSFQPLPPVVDGQSIDVLLEKKRAATGLKKASPVDRRILIRRASYDLTGLPPTPGEVDAFIADKSTDAYPRLIERLLASHAYGEKWGRHWLDVARYADSAGENSDRPLPHAWRYRNWVIDAINQDMAYDEFLRQQIAGDILAGKGPVESVPGKIIATGFLAVARRFGHEIDKDMHLTFEDTLDTLGKSVLGLSLGCARCHDHKYDPISTRDYYGLYGILQSTRYPFTGCEPKPLPKDLVPISSLETRARLAGWEKEMQVQDAGVKAGEAAIALQSKAFEKSLATLIASGDLAPVASQDMVAGNAGDSGILRVQKGEMLQLTVLPKANFGGDSTRLEWVISEEGSAGRVWNLAADYLDDPYQNGAGMQHKDRQGNQAVWHLFDVAASPRLFTEYIKDAEKSPGLMVWRGAAPWPALMINTRMETLQFQTVTLPGQSLAVHPGPKGGVAIAWESPADLSVKVRGKITKVDPGGDGVAWKLERRPGIGKALGEQKQLLHTLVGLVKSQEAARGRKPAEDLAFATVEAKPGNARIQKKGEPKDLGEEVPRGMPAILAGTVIPPGEGSGRLQLAQWLTSGQAGDLAARVMANRIWAGHFGTGIVPSLNDFGSRGTPPTDPDLLDFLSAHFRKNWSLKAMHRLIMASEAYQGSDFPRRRLTAEELRDTLLFVSGNMDRTIPGPHPFPVESSWNYTQHNPFKAVYDNNHRSVYQMVQRTQRHPYLALFDGADPNASTPSRTQSTVPTQALYFMNDPFVHNQARGLARRLISAAPIHEERLELATRILYGRGAIGEEKTLMREFLKETIASLPTLAKANQEEQAWSAWVRVLFCSNEMLYVD